MKHNKRKLKIPRNTIISTMDKKNTLDYSENSLRETCSRSVMSSIFRDTEYSTNDNLNTYMTTNTMNNMNNMTTNTINTMNNMTTNTINNTYHLKNMYDTYNSDNIRSLNPFYKETLANSKTSTNTTTLETSGKDFHIYVGSPVIRSTNTINNSYNKIDNTDETKQLFHGTLEWIKLHKTPIDVPIGPLLIIDSDKDIQWLVLQYKKIRDFDLASFSMSLDKYNPNLQINEKNNMNEMEKIEHNRIRKENIKKDNMKFVFKHILLPKFAKKYDINFPTSLLFREGGTWDNIGILYNYIKDITCN